jgi:biopolymer transport protein ExbD
MIAYSRSSPHFYAQKVELPSSTTPEKLEEDQKILEISVDEKGQIIVNNRTMEVSEIQKFLKKRPGMEKIIVRGDQKAPYEKIILVIDQIKEAGIPRVLLLTRKKVEES